MLWSSLLFILVSAPTLGAPLDASASLIDHTPVPPIVYDIRGNIIQNSVVGHPVVIAKNFTNSNDKEMDYTFLVEVRDESGITQYLAWQKSNALPMSTREVGVSWTPEIATEYEIRTFVVSNMTNPQVIDFVETAKFSVFAQVPKNNSYSLELDGRDYQIEYILGSGNVKKITTQASAGAINIELSMVDADTELTVTLPKDLMDLVFLDWVYPLPSGEKPGYTPEVVVDTIFVKPISVQEMQEGTTWVIPIREDSEEVEFFVGGPI
jgi:hypothetical protein